MTAITQKKTSNSIAFWVMLVLALLALGLGVYRMFVGLGPTTNLDDARPWGLWITLDMFLIPAAGAAFTISALGHFFGFPEHHRVIRPAIVTGLLGYLAAGVLLLMDLGRWHQFYNILVPGYINIHSFLWEVGLSVSLYTPILIIEVLPTLLERKNEAVTRLVHNTVIIIASIGIFFSCLHQSSIGSMWLILFHRLHALWWTPLLPLLYFLQALFGGLGMAMVAIYLTWKLLGKPVYKPVLLKTGRIIRWLLVIYLALKVGDWVVAGELGLLFSSGGYSLLVWAELLLGVILPLVLLFSKAGKRSDGVFWASIWTVMGLFLDRLIVSWIGMPEAAGGVYVPHWMEIVISVGVLSGLVLVYKYVARNYDLFPPEHEHDLEDVGEEILEGLEDIFDGDDDDDDGNDD